MSIIFEGVDGIGKTTDIRLFHIFNPGYVYIHNWAIAKNRADILSEASKEILLLESNQPILFDRSFIISEYVYAHVLSRDTPIDIHYIREWIKLVDRKNHTLKLLVFLNESILNIKSKDRELPFAKLNDLYRSLFSNIKPHKFILEEK